MRFTDFALLLAAAPSLLVKAANLLTVDCDNRLREATHCANGSLYGLIENVPDDKHFHELVTEIHPYVFRNPARGGYGNQHPFGNAIDVARRLKDTPGALMSVDLADILPYWPYKWPGMDQWIKEVKSFIKDKKASGLTNWYGLEIWNEAENTWRDSNGYSFLEFWKITYDVIRENDPDEKIIGPCDGLYSEQRLRPFLEYCKKNDCLPDIMCWHELMGIELVAPRYKAYRQLEKSLGIKELPITINEYCDVEHEYEGQPGSNARFIGKFERYKIDSALISWWFVPKPGRLGSLLATDNEKGAGWYFHKWYGDMTGDMLYVKPPNDNSKLVDGAACIDDEKQYISFIFGGPNDGTINASFVNLPEFIGDIAKVKVEKIDWVSKDTVSRGPSTIFEKEYDVSNGKLSVILTGCNATSGYRVYLTKGDGSSGKIEGPSDVPDSNVAEGTYKIINRHSGKALTVQNDSTGDAANVVQLTDTGKKSQQWVISEDGGFRILNVNANKSLDVEKNSVQDGGNVIIWPDTGSLNQRWLIEVNGDGYATITNFNSGKVLDVSSSSTADNANVLQWGGHGNENQQWKLVPVGEIKTKTKTTTIKKTTTAAPAPTTDASACSSRIVNQGYKCCSKNCLVVLTDDDGSWGIENGDWCGCPASAAVAGSCSASIISQGYACCSDSNCDVIATDDDGKWGVENNDWCGISSKCK